MPPIFGPINLFKRGTYLYHFDETTNSWKWTGPLDDVRHAGDLGNVTVGKDGGRALSKTTGNVTGRLLACGVIGLLTVGWLSRRAYASRSNSVFNEENIKAPKE